MKRRIDKELIEIEKTCSMLNICNKKYVIAVANALAFTQEKNKPPQKTA